MTVGKKFALIFSILFVAVLTGEFFVFNTIRKITGIAFQTNLLALNVAVEVASMGKGLP